MNRILILSSVLFISACGHTCVEKYTEYLDLPSCSETLTKDCKKQSVINAANDLESEFYEALKTYKVAHDADKVTTMEASRYVSAKDSFCKFIDNIEE